MPNRNQNYTGFRLKDNDLIALINMEEVTWFEQLTVSTVVHLKNGESVEIKEQMSRIVELLKQIIW